MTRLNGELTETETQEATSINHVGRCVLGLSYPGDYGCPLFDNDRVVVTLSNGSVNEQSGIREDAVLVPEFKPVSKKHPSDSAFSRGVFLPYSKTWKFEGATTGREICETKPAACDEVGK